MRSLYLLLVILGLALFAAMMVGCAPSQATHASSVVKINVGEGHGSGVHLGNGLIITAAHVVNGMEPLRITDDGGAIHKAERMWANTVFDLAMVKMETPDDVAVSEMICTIPEVGDLVEAVGYPLNLGKVHSWGTVSSGARSIDGAWRMANSTDMSLIFGQSGGPVFNPQKRVVGFVVGGASIRGSWTAFTFIVPSQVACDLLGRA
jgi:serine protease Do